MCVSPRLTDTGSTIVDNGGNQIGTGGTPIAPVLGPLADNGGTTEMHALLVGSSAMDMGDLRTEDSATATDDDEPWLAEELLERVFG